jgi:RNA polymerase sigma-32 factor
MKPPSEKPLSREVELELARKYKESGDMLAAHRLILSNTGLVRKIAHQFRRYKVPFDDLVQEGFRGMMHGLKKFDPNKGYRLATYAAWWIRAYIIRHVMDNWSMVKYGTVQGEREAFFKYQRGDLPSDESEVRLAMGDFHLDSPVLLHRRSGSAFEPVPITHLDMLKCDSPSPNECAALSEKQIMVQSVIADMASSMSVHERMLIKYRLLTHNPWTFEKLAKELSISRQRVQQKEARLKRKLRDRFVAEGL